VARASLLLAAAFAGVAVAVALGGFDGTDQWAVDHVMAWLSTETHEVTFASALRPVQPWTPAAEIPVDAWLYLASVPVSALVLAAACATLRRRGLRVAAAAWAVAWVAGNAVEVVGKTVVVRPPLHALGRHLVGFDDSFPSGHTLRGVLLAALVGLVWPRLRVVAAGWLAAALVLLVVASWHTPSDVLGGALLAGALAAAASAVSERAADGRGEDVDVLVGRVPGGHPADDPGRLVPDVER
jgi:membrane-associated phospholipid phosphatase